jgi:Arc/MetJ-type ribon-helix-helix transcriptional regulator
MSIMVSVRLPEWQTAILDEAVRRGRYASRAEALRDLVDRFAREERHRDLAQRFARAYAEPPDHDERALHALEDEAARRLLAEP